MTDHVPLHKLLRRCQGPGDGVSFVLDCTEDLCTTFLEAHGYWGYSTLCIPLDHQKGIGLLGHSPYIVFLAVKAMCNRQSHVYCLSVELQCDQLQGLTMT
jgi:hypothetical protein